MYIISSGKASPAESRRFFPRTSGVLKLKLREMECAIDSNRPPGEENAVSAALLAHFPAVSQLHVCLEVTLASSFLEQVSLKNNKTSLFWTVTESLAGVPSSDYKRFNPLNCFVEFFENNWKSVKKYIPSFGSLVFETVFLHLCRPNQQC